MRKLVFVTLFFSVFVHAQTNETAAINTTLDAWHKAAATANYENYFGLMTQDAIFIGTDATEYWNKKGFQIFAKPYFDKGKAWSFTALERHVYFDKTGKTAWFDELLSTQMKICRGSGVLVKIGKEWKIQHYVLSMTIPNDNADTIVKIKTPIEDVLIKKIELKQ
jgi:ketosteroid isomerase-like protein